jgi:asparagine synthase (glutamine-hydrolysing)
MHRQHEAAEARRLVRRASRRTFVIDGSFARHAVDGITVRLARSLDRPMRYFLAKRHEGRLYVSDRIDTATGACRDGLARNSPSYTRMVPAHHLVRSRCGLPGSVGLRAITLHAAHTHPATVEDLGRQHVGRVARDRVAAFESRRTAASEPIGVAFSGGIDSGAPFCSSITTR